MTATRCPFATWRPIAANFAHGGRQQIRGFVPHVQVGYGSLWGFFDTPKPPGEGASADFWCSKTGVLEQYVDLADTAWAQGYKAHNGNPFFVSCEFEGMPDEDMTAQQVDMGGRLIAWVYTDVATFPLVVNVDPDGAGITPHHVFGGGHTCPGPGPRENQFPDLIAAALRWLNPEQPPHQEYDMTPGQCFDMTGRHWYFTVGDDKALWASVDGASPFVLGGEWTSGVSAVLNESGSITVAGRGKDGVLWQAIVHAEKNAPPEFYAVGGHIYPAA